MNCSIILINIYYPESGYGEKLNYPPLGLAYLSEFLDKNDIEHIVIDQGLGYTQKDILRKISEIKPDWVGISLNSLLINKSIDLINKINENNPETRIVVGGPHVTTKRKEIFNELKTIEFAVVGEGGESFLKLVTGKRKKEIEGLIYTDEEGTLVSNNRRITKDINTIPFPRFMKFELNSYLTRAIPIITSRGCPFKCVFCQQSSLLSKKWRGISAANFIEILKYWEERGHKEIHVLDDNFAFNEKRLERIAELYEKQGLHKIKLTLVGGVRISSATKKNLELFKRIGVDYISFGVESFSDEVLRFIKKGTTVKRIQEAIKNSTDMGFKVRLFFIVGFPYETVESLRKIYKMVLKYPVYQVRFFNLIPYENTEIMDWLEENGKMLTPPKEYMNDFKKYQDIPVFEAEHTMSPEERTYELKIARKFADLINDRSKYLFDELM